MSAINALNSSLQDSTLASKVSLAVAHKTLDVAKTQGEAAVALLHEAAKLQQQAAPTPAGSTSSGSGQLLDILA